MVNTNLSRNWRFSSLAASCPVSPLRSSLCGVCVSYVGMMSLRVLHLSRQRSPPTPLRCHESCDTRRIEDAGACHHADSAKVMTHTPHRELLRYVRIHWLRWQCAVASLYFQRVTYPVQCWVACGRPPQFRPQLPWWQPFVWHWLHITGWLRASGRRGRSV